MLFSSWYDYWDVDKDGKVKTELNLAGTPKEDINVKVSDRILSVYKKNQKIYSVKIPTYLDPESVKAEYKHGLLALSLGESEKNSREVSIDVT